MTRRRAPTYWIGGGSAAGKTTVATRLADKHGWHRLSTDASMGDHAGRLTSQQAPLLHAFIAKSMDQRWVDDPPEVLLETFHWFAGEGFHLIVEDLAALPPDRPVVVEGFRLLPAQVGPQLTANDGAVWLLPTPTFRRAALEARGSLWDIPGRTRDPERALANVLARDALFTDRLVREVADAGLHGVRIDGSLDAAQIANRVEQLLQGPARRS